MFAERHQKLVDGHPVLLGEDSGEGIVGPLRGAGGDVAPTVRDAVNVDIHADNRLAAGNPEREVGALDPNTGEGAHRRLVTGQVAAELNDDALGDVADLDGFALVEGGGPDELVDLLRGERRDVGGGPGDGE